MSNPTTGGPIRVLVVDDSALMRQVITGLLQGAGDISVVGAAADPLAAREMIKALNPHVMTLDIEMPRMDGLAFLERVMTLRPMPVVMVSSLTQAGADATLRALELGAVDFIGKPAVDLRDGMAALAETLIGKIRAAARARVRPLVARADASPARPFAVASTERLIAIGASTGGVEAVREVIAALPADAPAVLVTQHMPAAFTASFAARLDSISAMRVVEASDRDRILPGHVYVARGAYHLRVARAGANYVCALGDDPPISGHRPSVDALFESVAEHAGARAIGAILTGMGRDGAAGLLRMRQSGAVTLGQDEASCVVYGMPKAARQAGAVAKEVPLERIAEELRLACLSGPRGIRI